MFYTEIEGLIKSEGHAITIINGHMVKLDLSNPHERRYAACSILHIEYPQFDIDKMLINHFVRPGDIILDAGANIGLTALLFLEAGASRVSAIEPLPDLNTRIKDINCDAIKTFRAALSSSPGVIDFFVSESHNQGSTYDIESVNMFRHIFNEKIKTIAVPKITIDGLNDSFDIWKMDIEGAETDAVMGAQRTLKTSPPRVIMAELWGDKFTEFYDRIKDTHKYVYRAAISNSDYSLVFIKPEEFSDREHEFHSISPTFVFTQIDI